MDQKQTGFAMPKVAFHFGDPHTAQYTHVYCIDLRCQLFWDEMIRLIIGFIVSLCW